MKNGHLSTSVQFSRLAKQYPEFQPDIKKELDMSKYFILKTLKSANTTRTELVIKIKHEILESSDLWALVDILKSRVQYTKDMLFFYNTWDNSGLKKFLIDLIPKLENSIIQYEAKEIKKFVPIFYNIYEPIDKIVDEIVNFALSNSSIRTKKIKGQARFEAFLEELPDALAEFKISENIKLQVERLLGLRINQIKNWYGTVTDTKIEATKTAVIYGSIEAETSDNVIIPTKFSEIFDSIKTKEYIEATYIHSVNNFEDLFSIGIEREQHLQDALAYAAGKIPDDKEKVRDKLFPIYATAFLLKVYDQKIPKQNTDLNWSLNKILSYNEGVEKSSQYNIKNIILEAYILNEDNNNQLKL